MKKRVLSIILATALCITLMPATAASSVVDSGVVGGAAWTLYDDHTLRITGSGEIGALAGAHAAEVVTVVIGKGITGISSRAFSGFSALKTVVFEGSEPQSVGDDVFPRSSDDLIVHVARSELSWTESEKYDIVAKTWDGYHLHFTDGRNIKPVTCETEGYTGDRFCNSCGGIVSTGSVIYPEGHKSAIINAKEPTCVTQGYTGDAVCSVCKKTMVYGSVIPAKGHIWGGGKITVEPTEEAEGYRTFTCLVCRSTYSEVIPKLSHVHNYADTVTEPSCTARGYTTHTCACGDSYVSAYVEPLGHSWDNGRVTVKPTEIKTGVMTYTCTRCKALRFETIPKIDPEDSPFADVFRSDYYFEPVLWAYKNNVTGGVDAEHFDPYGVCTRAHVVTFLWRAAGEPEPMRADTALTDVSPGSYYYKAVLWAVENGIVSGYSDGSFRPNYPCTRAHVVTFLWRWEGRPYAQKEVQLSDLDGLTSDFLLAIKWAASADITSGYDDGSFRPNEACTRAHVVTFIWRDIVNYK